MMIIIIFFRFFNIFTHFYKEINYFKERKNHINFSILLFLNYKLIY